MQQPEIPQELDAWLLDAVGTYETVGNYRQHDARTGVWKVRTGPDDYFVKIHREKRKWHPEVYAYRHWIAAYEPHAPQLVDIIEEENLQGILTTALNGMPLREAGLSDEQARRVYFSAGKVARRVHELETGTWFGIPTAQGQPLNMVFTDPVSYMTHDFHEWCGNAPRGDLLDARELELAHWAIENMDQYEGEKPVPINNDYSPGNWLVDENGEFAGVIDLECMLWGVQVDSFALLWQRRFHTLAGSEQAFFAGYGGNPRHDKPGQVRNVRIKMAISDIVWGMQHSMRYLVERGHEVLQALASKAR